MYALIQLAVVVLCLVHNMMLDPELCRKCSSDAGIELISNPVHKHMISNNQIVEFLDDTNSI